MANMVRDETKLVRAEFYTTAASQQIHGRKRKEKREGKEKQGGNEVIQVLNHSYPPRSVFKVNRF